MAKKNDVKTAPAPEKNYHIFVALRDGSTIRGPKGDIDLVSHCAGPVSEGVLNSVLNAWQYREALIRVETLDGWAFAVPVDNVGYIHFKPMPVVTPEPVSDTI